MEQKKNWNVYRIYLLVLGIVAILIFCACTTSKTSTDFTDYHSGDSASIVHENQGGVEQTSLNMDSIFNVWMQRISSQQTSNEQSTERVTETITSYMDSLGREVRQEQRTIDRSEARQQQIQQQQWMQQQEQRISREYQRIDSLYHLLEGKWQVHWEDSTSMQQAKEPVETLSLWGRVEQWFGKLVIGATLLLLIMLGIWFLKNRMKK